MHETVDSLTNNIKKWEVLYQHLMYKLTADTILVKWNLHVHLSVKKLLKGKLNYPRNKIGTYKYVASFELS